MELERRWLGRAYWEVGAVTALALVVRLVHLDTLDYADDYYHLLAAQAFLREGTFSIAGGEPYGRAPLFTYIVAGFMHVFGESRWVARLPALLAGAALVGVLFAWLRSVAGRRAAWFGALFLCFDVVWGIALSQNVRFYSLHSLMFFLGAVGVYELVVRRPAWPRNVLLFGAAVTALGVAFHLHLTTVIGVIALAVWLGVELGPLALRYVVANPRAGMVVGGGVALVSGLIVFAIVAGDTAAAWWGAFRSVPGHAAEYQDQTGYYFRGLRRTYPVFWGLFPAALILAIVRVGRPAVFAAVLFCVAFVLHSVADFKAYRFISYAIPFLFAIWGMAIAAILPAVVRAASEAVISLLTFRPRESLLRLASWGIVAMVAGGIALTTPGFSGSYERIRPGPLRAQEFYTNWHLAATHLSRDVAAADVVIGTYGPNALYYLGRVDVVVGEDHMPAGVTRQFVQARQMGKPVITTAEALEILIGCFRSGLVAIDKNHWGFDYGFSEDLVRMIEARGEPIPLPEHANVHAFRWTNGGDAAPAEGCPNLGLPRHASGDLADRER